MPTPRLTLGVITTCLCILEAGAILPPSVARIPSSTGLATIVRSIKTRHSMPVTRLRSLIESFKMGRPQAQGVKVMDPARSFTQPTVRSQQQGLGVGDIRIGIADRHDCGELTLRDNDKDQNHHRGCSTSSTTPLPTTPPLPSSTASPTSPATTPAPIPPAPPEPPTPVLPHEWGLIFLVPSSLFVIFRLVRRLHPFVLRGLAAATYQ